MRECVCVCVLAMLPALLLPINRLEEVRNRSFTACARARACVCVCV